MKIIIYITIFLMSVTAITFSQSVIEFEAGTSLTNDSGADISADVFIINGTYTGGGTINGNTAYVLKLTALIQGFYNPSTDIMLSDTIAVYLRNDFAPFAIVDSAKSVLNNSGIGTFIFSNAINGTNYFIDVSHRNSIETWSAAGQSFASFFGTYDFSTANTQAYGNNMVQIDATPVKFGLYSGDVNKDATVDASDLSDADNDALNSISGYVPTDVTGDDFVDAEDVSIIDNNASNSVSVITP